MSCSPGDGDGFADNQSVLTPAKTRFWRRSKENLSPWKLSKAKQIMIQKMNQKCLIEDVARECAMSRSHFTRAFKNATGLPPQDWLRNVRLQKAKQLLKDRRFTISRIALECGFGDQSHFTRVFRAVTGVSPRRWRLDSCLGT